MSNPQSESAYFIHCYAGYGRTGHIIILINMYWSVMDGEPEMHYIYTQGNIVKLFSLLKDRLTKIYCPESSNEIFKDDLYGEDLDLCNLRFNQIVTFIHYCNCKKHGRGSETPIWLKIDKQTDFDSPHNFLSMVPTTFTHIWD
jgi:hypothetical protein